MASPPDAERTTLEGGSLWRWIGVAVAPVLLTFLGIVAFVSTIDPDPVASVPLVVYDLANVLVVGTLFVLLSDRARSAVFRFRRPSLEEIGLAVVLAALLPFLFEPVADLVSRALGFADGGAGVGIESTVGAVVLAASAILVAPLLEEVLFRGLVFGSLLARVGPWSAVAGSSLLFGLVHLPIGGGSSLVSAGLAGLVLAGLRLRYDNLAGPVITHALSNAWGVAAALSLVPDVAPL